MDKQNAVIFIQWNVIWPKHADISYSMDGPWKHYTKGKKSFTNDAYYMIPFI